MGNFPKSSHQLINDITKDIIELTAVSKEDESKTGAIIYDYLYLLKSVVTAEIKTKVEKQINVAFLNL